MLHCFKQFDGLNFDGLAGKLQKRQNFPPGQNFVLYGNSQPPFLFPQDECFVVTTMFHSGQLNICCSTVINYYIGLVV